jgi:SAM-dependent methyltransferase
MGLHPTINTVVSKRNIGELKTIVDLLAGIGHLKLKFSMIEPKGLAKENFSQVVPSLADTARAVSEAISFGLDHYGERDVEFAFDAIPFCAIPEYVHLFDDLFSNGIYAMSEADEPGLVPVDYNNHCFPIPCKRCSLMGYCPGPFKEYFSKAGDAELLPVTETRSNQFLMTNTGLSFKPSKSTCAETAKRSCDELSILVDAGQKGVKVYRAETGDFSVPQIRSVLKNEQVFKIKGNKTIPLKPLKPCLKCGGCNGIYKEAKPAGPNMKALTTVVGGIRGRVLDVGCGQVELWKKIGPLVTSGKVEYHALDPDPARIDLIARKSVKVVAHTTRIEDFSPLPGSFDVCMMLGSINHVFDVAAALGKVYEALKPGGALIVADDCPTALVADEIPGGDAGFEHYRNLDSASAAALMEDCGFAVERELPVKPATEPRWVVFARKPA